MVLLAWSYAYTVLTIPVIAWRAWRRRDELVFWVSLLVAALAYVVVGIRPDDMAGGVQSGDIGYLIRYLVARVAFEAVAGNLAGRVLMLTGYSLVVYAGGALSLLVLVRLLWLGYQRFPDEARLPIVYGSMLIGACMVLPFLGRSFDREEILNASYGERWFLVHQLVFLYAIAVAWARALAKATTRLRVLLMAAALALVGGLNWVNRPDWVTSREEGISVARFLRTATRRRRAGTMPVDGLVYDRPGWPILVK